MADEAAATAAEMSILALAELSAPSRDGEFHSHHKPPHGDGRPCELGLWHDGPCPSAG